MHFLHLDKFSTLRASLRPSSNQEAPPLRKSSLREGVSHQQSCVGVRIDRLRRSAYPLGMTVELSKETQQSLEAYLAEKGLQKNAMPGVVEEAIEDFLFRQALRGAHGRNARLEPGEVEATVEDVVRDYRQGQPSR